eukprot:m.25716 g.25716  ORF g.25716 m.25716 type:complete len:96 (+) comp5794_c0_seq1:905-1192(+)
MCCDVRKGWYVRVFDGPSSKVVAHIGFTSKCRKSSIFTSKWQIGKLLITLEMLHFRVFPVPNCRPFLTKKKCKKWFPDSVFQKGLKLAKRPPMSI